MNQRRIHPFGLGTRFSPLCGPDDEAAESDLTINFVVEIKHEPDQWRGSFAFYANALDTSRDMFGHPDMPAMTGLSLWRYPFPSLADLN